MQTAVQKLAKTRNTINAFIARGGNYGTQRAMELIDRYNDLKASVVKVGGYSNPEWRAYCESIKADVSHDGYDLFA